MATSPRLVGRESALAAAASALDLARRGVGQFVLVHGEAGIGKTAVLATLAEWAEPDCLVLRGFCWEGSGVPPYWPWTQVLRATGLSIDDLGTAGWLLDAGGPAGPQDGAAAADAQFRLFDGVARCLTGLAADRPVVVLLDDLQWADEASLAVLAFLARAVSGSRVLLVGAYRDTEACPPLMALAASAQHIPLLGLDLLDVEAMTGAILGAPPAQAVVAQLWRRSGGNPFFVRELARLMQAQGPDQAPIRPPAGVIETVRRRLARLPTDCVRLLDWAAVAGRDIDLGLLVHSGAAPDEAAALELLTPAGHAGVIILGPAPAFAHDLFREAILDGLPFATAQAINLEIGRALQARSGNAARIAAHLLGAGPLAQPDAIDYCIRAGRAATAHLGHDDACGHYLRALNLLAETDPVRIDVLNELAAAHARAGASPAALDCYREAADLSRHADNRVALALAALGIQSLGHRSGAPNTEVLDLLREAAHALEITGGSLALRSRVAAASVRALRHGTQARPSADLIDTAQQAVKLAQASFDTDALAAATLAVHDAMWTPGSAAARLPIIAAMLDAARAAGNADLIAEAHLLQAAAHLELGDPVGRDELLTYITLAGNLGHARGRWSALTRKATYAQIAGRADEAAYLGEQALALGEAIGEPDALGCYCTARWSLVALGVPEPDNNMDRADPLWPMFPLIAAWPAAVRGDLETARQALGDFSVLDIAIWTDLERLAVAAVVFAAIGTHEQRTWTYETLRPFSGTHVVVGGAAAYHAAVDHHLGTLAAAIGDHQAAETHFETAIAMHERVGAAGWTRLSRQALTQLSSTAAADNEFRFIDGHWVITYAGKHIQLPDAKGLHDLWIILGSRGDDVHVLTLLAPDTAHAVAATGADPILDERAKANYRQRLDLLAQQIADADGLGHTERADRLGTERDALIHELATATGLGGRPRRLGDHTERARKTVSARIRDALTKIDHTHPDLATHLRGAVRMGTTCRYAPTRPTPWTLN